MSDILQGRCIFLLLTQSYLSLYNHCTDISLQRSTGLTAFAKNVGCHKGTHEHRVWDQGECVQNLAFPLIVGLWAILLL